MTRSVLGRTVMTCNDCGDAITMNKLCEKPLQSARDMLKHIAHHNASRSVASVVPVSRPQPESVPTVGFASALGIAASWSSPSFESRN